MTATRKPGRPVDPDLQERRRREILDAAAKLFAEKGYGHADTQDLADRLDVSKGTIFRYFPSKRELFEASVIHGLERLQTAVDSEVAGVSDPLDMLLAAMTAYLRFFDASPEVVELLILERAEFKDRKSSYFENKDKCDESSERWNGVLSALVQDGRFRDIPADRIRNVIGDLLYGTIFSNHMSGRTRRLEDQARDLFDIVFHGLLTDAERARSVVARQVSETQPAKTSRVTRSRRDER
ncbi:MAG: TetR/AcrR family transcriptional regulator [Pirellulales bacterium]